MANELKITDVVDQGVFDDLKKLKKEFNENYAAYKQFIELLASGMKTSPKNYQELSDKSNAYNNALNNLITTQNKLASIQERQNKLLEDYGKKVTKLLTLNTLPKQFDDLTKTINKLSSSLDVLSSKFQSTSSAQNSAAQANQSYTQSANQLNQAISTTEAKYTEIVDNILTYDSHVTKLTADTIQNKIRIKELGDELKSLDKEYKNGAIGITEYLNKSALLKQRQTELSEQNKQYSNLIRNHSAVIISTASSYNEMNAAVLALEKRLKNMPKDSFLGAEGQNTLQQIQTLKNELKSMDAQMGNYQRNVGNYTSHWNGLNMSVQQVARELPSLAVGWNTFFLAISNNLPMLADELKKARIEYQAMQEAGEKGIPVWKQLTKSIFNWQTALVVGITLLSVYGKDIINWVASLFKGKGAIDDIVSAERMWVDAIKEGRASSIKERRELELLYKATQDTSRSMQERNAAVDELQRKFPEYFENISNEDFLAGKAADSYNRLAGQILKTAQARAIQDKLVERSKEQLEYEDQLNNLFYERSVLNNKIRDAERRLTKGPAAATNAARDIYDLGKEAADLDEKISEMQSKLRENERQTIKLENKLNIDDLLNPLGKTEGKVEKSADEQAKYQEDIAKRLSDTRISLIDDEYEKERALAQKKYEENIASIKGNSEEENKLRANYEEILQNELSAIDKKYLDKIDEEERKRVKDSVKNQLEEKQREYATLAIVASQNMQKEINDELERYRQGIISKEQYEKNKAEITQKYALLEAQRAIDLLKEQIEISGLSDEEKFKIKEALAKAEINLSNKVRETKEKNRDKETEDEKKYWAELEASLQHLENVSNNAVDGLGTLFSGLMSIITKVVRDGKIEIEDLLGSISAISEGLTSIMVGMYDQQIEKIEEQQEKNEEAGEEEKERIEDLVESGVITKEEGEARKRAADKATADKNKELEKQKAELEQRQAKWQKANSIVQTTIATSQAIMMALAQAGPIAGAVLAAVIGAMGAAQVAMIAAQPIPKYAKGTDNHPGGLAIVGDGGRQEVIETDNGAYITPAVPTLVDIPKRARVIPNLVDYRKMSLHSDALMLDRQRRSNDGDPVIVNVNNDYRRLERNTEATNEGIAKLNRTFRKMARASEYHRLANRI
nr:MAG TPA: tail tape measure protein [Caudoviricetes sp.]